LDGLKTVGYMSFNNTAASYTVGTAGSGNLTFSNSDTAAAQVFVNAGNHTIAENSTLASNLVIFTPTATSLTPPGGCTISCAVSTSRCGSPSRAK